MKTCNVGIVQIVRFKNQEMFAYHQTSTFYFETKTNV